MQFTTTVNLFSRSQKIRDYYILLSENCVYEMKAKYVYSSSGSNRKKLQSCQIRFQKL